MSSINVAMDASSVVNAATQMVSSFNSISSSVRQAALDTAKYDSAGNFLSGTIKGIDSQGRAFVSTLNQLGPGLAITGTKFTSMGKNVDDTKNKISDLNKAVNDLSGMFQRFVGYKALNAITDGFNSGFEAARKFQTEISLIRAISQDQQLSFGQWAKGIRAVSDETGFDLADTTKAAYDAISNQVVKGQQTFGFLKEAGNLARVNLGATLEQSVNLLSSSINVYGTSVLNAKEKSALFFATIDEGRVTMQDMANTYGRVAILAKSLSVAETDLAASIAFLTQKGVTTDDAFTFMRNVFVQLQKPSEALQALFSKLGVSSGEMAIRTYGTIGIFRKLKDEVQSGNSDIAKLFPEIRAQQPITAALGDFEGFTRISDKFNDITARVQDYQKAIDIRGESPADFINKEFNKIKNTFTADVGQKITEVAKDLLVAFTSVSKFFTGKDSLQDGLNAVLIVIRDLTIAVVAYRTATAIATAVTAGYNAAVAAAGANASRTTVAVTLLNRAFAASVIGLVAAGAALVLTHKYLGDFKTNVPVFEEMTDGIKKMREEALKFELAKIPNPFADFQKNSQKEFEGTLQGLAKLSTNAEQNLSAIRDSNKKTTDSFQNAFQGYTDSLKKNINELGKKINESEDLIKRTRKNALTFRDELNKISDDFALGHTSGQQKINFLAGQQKALVDRARGAFATGKPEDAAEGERLLKEAAQTAKQRAEAQVEFFKQQNPKATDLDVNNFAQNVRDNSLQKELIQLNQLRLQLGDKLIAQKQQEIDLTTKQQAAEKLALRTVEDQFKAFNEFSAFDKGGNLKTQFKSKESGRADIGRLQKEFDIQAENLRSSVSKTGDVSARIQIEELIAKRRKELASEIQSYERSESVKTLQQRTINLQKQHEIDIAKIKENAQKEAKAQQAGLEAAGEFSKSFRGSADKALDFTDYTPGTNRPIVQKQIQNVQALADVYDRALEKAKREVDIVNGETVAKPENILALKQASNDLSAALRELYTPIVRQASGGKGTYDTAIAPGTKQTFGEIESYFKLEIDKLVSGSGRIGGIGADQELAQQNYNEQVKPGLDKLKSLAPDAFTDLNAQTKQVAAGMSDTARSVYEFKAALDAVKDSFNKLGAPQPVTPRDTFIPPTTDSGAKPRGYARGGWIGGGPTGMNGPDDQWIGARTGEYMVNAESAGMFSDTLEAINSARRGFIPGILGGNVSKQSIGDIYITVNESKDGQSTSREVWSKLRREMRRGNIKG